MKQDVRSRRAKDDGLNGVKVIFRPKEVGKMTCDIVHQQQQRIKSGLLWSSLSTSLGDVLHLSMEG